ncbi:unnamed protein product, partial [Oikopleura dioica]
SSAACASSEINNLLIGRVPARYRLFFKQQSDNKIHHCLLNITATNQITSLNLRKNLEKF